MAWFPLDPGRGSGAGLRPDRGGRDARAPGGGLLPSLLLLKGGGAPACRAAGLPMRQNRLAW